MKIYTYREKLNTLHCEEYGIDTGKTIFFDIETTGLSAKNSYIYMIGYGITDNTGNADITLLFNDDGTPVSEKEILMYFTNVSGQFSHILTYNGNTFDIPYVRERLKKHDLADIFEPMTSIDLFVLIRKYKAKLHLNSCHQSDIEELCGIHRNDFCSGGKLIDVYKKFLKTKNKDLKATSGSAALSAVLAGITEPAIYGITLKYKKPFAIGAVFSAIAGAIVAWAGTGVPTLVGTSILTLPAYIGKGFAGFCVACAIAYFGAAIVTYFFGFDDSMILGGNESAAKEEAKTEAKAGEVILAAPVDGECVAVENIKDPVFSSGALGKGVAFIPENGEIKAPAECEITMVADTGHAVGFTTDNGAEVLIHIGMDTVEMKGKGFSVHVKEGQKVKKGQLLVTVDLAAVKAAGFETTTPMVVTNSDDFKDPEILGKGIVKTGDAVIRVEN